MSSELAQLRRELTSRGVYWDLRWGVQELRDWLKVKLADAPRMRSQCELSFRLEHFAVKIAPDALVPYRKFHLRLTAGSRVLVEVPVEEISDQLPPLQRCVVPGNSRQSVCEGTTLCLHVVCKDRSQRQSLGSLDVRVDDFLSRREFVIRDLTDWGVQYEVQISDQFLSLTHRKFRLIATVVLATLRISKMSAMRKALAEAEVKREISRLEEELAFLEAENARMKKRLEVELAVKNSTASPAVPPVNFLPSFDRRPLLSASLAQAPPEPRPPAPVAVPAAAMSRPPDPPATREVKLKLRSSEKVVISEAPLERPVERVPEIAAPREPQTAITAMSSSQEAVDKIANWYKEMTAEPKPGPQPLPVVSRKAAKVDKILDLSILEISSIVLAKETSWLSAISASTGTGVVQIKLEFRVLKGTRAVDVAVSNTFFLKGTRAEIKQDEGKISLNYISAEADELVISISLFVEEAPVAVGGMRLIDLGDEEITLALSATGAKLDSDPILTLAKFVQPPVAHAASSAAAMGANTEKIREENTEQIAEKADERKSSPKTLPKPAAPKPKTEIPTDPKQRAIYVAKQREALAKAKQEMIDKQKRQIIEEQKYVMNKAKEIAVLKKVMPPPDNFKFPGMPGPPPFKPKVALQAPAAAAQGPAEGSDSR